MSGLLQSELHKLTSVRTTWTLTAVGALLAALAAGAVAFVPDVAGPFDGNQAQVADAVGRVGGTSAIVLVVGLLVMTTEYQHGTIGRTLQVTPSRTRVIIAKLLTGFAYALAFTAIGLTVVAIVLGIGALSHSVGLELGSQMWTATWQSAVALTLTTILAVAVGALLRGQVLALSVSLAWFFMIEHLLLALWPTLGRWLPFWLLRWIVVDPYNPASGPAVPATIDPLEPALALIVFLAYVIAATGAAITLMRVRDI